MRDYNYRAPTTPMNELSPTATRGAAGLVVDLGPHVKTPDEAKQAFGKLAYAFKGLTLSATTVRFASREGT